MLRRKWLSAVSEAAKKAVILKCWKLFFWQNYCDITCAILSEKEQCFKNKANTLELGIDMTPGSEDIVFIGVGIYAMLRGKCSGNLIQKTF